MAGRPGNSIVASAPSFEVPVFSLEPIERVGDDASGYFLCLRDDKIPFMSEVGKMKVSGDLLVLLADRHACSAYFRTTSLKQKWFSKLPVNHD
jgi:hypothetical protein